MADDDTGLLEKINRDKPDLAAVLRPEPPPKTEVPGADAPPTEPTPPPPEDVARKQKRDALTDQAADLLVSGGKSKMAAAQEYRKEVTPVIAAAQTATAAPMPQRPQQQQSPMVPQIQQTTNDWMATAYVFSALAGALVRHNSTGALSAMGGMLNGFAQGRDDAIKQNFEQWDRENKRALEINKQKMDEYKAAMEDRSRPIEQARAQMELIAAKYQDQVMMGAAAKDFETAASLYDRQFESQTKMEKSTLALQDLRQKVEERAKAAALKSQAVLTDEQAKAMAERAYAGDTSALTTIGGRGVERQINVNKINGYLTQMMKDNNDPPDKIAKAVATMRAYAAGQSSEARAGGNRAAQLEMVTSVLNQAIPQARAASAAVSRSEWVAYNQALQSGKRQFSDPALKTLDIVNIQLAELWAKAMNPTGAMTQGNRDLALKLLRAADGPRAYEAALNALEEAVKREKAGVAQARQGMPGGSLGPQQQQQSVPVTATGPDGKKIILQNGQWQPMQ